MSQNEGIGYSLPHNCRITHGTGAEVKKPFDDIDLTMHNFSIKSATAFSGQLGFIEFNTDYRLPRHVHMDLNQERLIDERILVLNGVGLVEILGEYLVVAPGSLADITGGVPHTWTACPPGVQLPDGTVSNGTFTMIYEYEDVTRFFPTKSTKVVKSVSEYEAHKGSLDEIRIAKLSVEEVVKQATIVYNKERLPLRAAR